MFIGAVVLLLTKPARRSYSHHQISFHLLFLMIYRTIWNMCLIPRVKLPKTENNWNIANDYFKLHLHHNSEITHINLTIRTFNQTVYNYFHICCGPVIPIDNDLELKKKYINFSNKLKKVLKSLKVDKITNITEIKYVNRLLRSKLRKQEQPDAFNHNDRIKENYWKYCKNLFETNETVLSTF